jgi:hypothetical protein
MEDSDHLYALTTLRLGKESWTPIGEEAVWAPDMVAKRKILTPLMNGIVGVHTIASHVTELSRLMKVLDTVLF